MTKKIFGKATMKLAGVSFDNRQGKLQNVRTAKSAFLTVRRDKKNEKDPNAVKVLAHTTSKNGKKSVFCIGYIPAEKAVWVANALDNNKIVRISKFEITGGGKATLGCNITLVHELYETEVADAVPAEAKAE